MQITYIHRHTHTHTQIYHIQNRGGFATMLINFVISFMSGIYLTKTCASLSLYSPVSNKLIDGRRIKGIN